jgi:hypothetical protein
MRLVIGYAYGSNVSILLVNVIWCVSICNLFNIHVATCVSSVSMYDENKVTIMFQSVSSSITKFTKYN